MYRAFTRPSPISTLLPLERLVLGMSSYCQKFLYLNSRVTFSMTFLRYFLTLLCIINIM